MQRKRRLLLYGRQKEARASSSWPDAFVKDQRPVHCFDCCRNLSRKTSFLYNTAHLSLLLTQVFVPSRRKLAVVGRCTFRLVYFHVEGPVALPHQDVCAAAPGSLVLIFSTLTHEYSAEKLRQTLLYTFQELKGVRGNNMEMTTFTSTRFSSPRPSLVVSKLGSLTTFSAGFVRLFLGSRKRPR